MLPLRAILPLAYMAGLFALSSLPGSKIGRWGLSPLLFNVAHVPLFAGLAWATLWAVPGSARLRALWVAAICFVFAVSDEVHQAFVPGRFFSWADLVADSAGIGFGVLFGLWTLPSITSRRGKPAI